MNSLIQSKWRFCIYFPANSSPKIFAPTAPLRFDGLNNSEQSELKGAAWYQAGIPREISLEVLSRQSPGAFLVRQSSTKPGCFALSLRVPPPAQKVAHYLILRTPRGYKIKVSSPSIQLPASLSTSDGCDLRTFRLLFDRYSSLPFQGFTKEFSSLRALITHHSVMPELLPVPLTLPRPHNQIPPRRDLDDFDTYGSLSDFRKMMADLNVWGSYVYKTNPLLSLYINNIHIFNIFNVFVHNIELRVHSINIAIP